jgi:hypothetical protein
MFHVPKLPNTDKQYMKNQHLQNAVFSKEPIVVAAFMKNAYGVNTP